MYVSRYIHRINPSNQMNNAYLWVARELEGGLILIEPNLHRHLYNKVIHVQIVLSIIRNTETHTNRNQTNNAYFLSQPGGGNVTEPGVEPTPSRCMTADSTTHLKQSAVMSGTGIHRLIYRDICVAATHNTVGLPVSLNVRSSLLNPICIAIFPLNLFI